MYSPDLCTEYELETCLYETKVFVSYKDEYYFFVYYFFFIYWETQILIY